jgi:hypothetical protein
MNSIIAYTDGFDGWRVGRSTTIRVIYAATFARPIDVPAGSPISGMAEYGASANAFPM